MTRSIIPHSNQNLGQLNIKSVSIARGLFPRFLDYIQLYAVAYTVYVNTDEL